MEYRHDKEANTIIDPPCRICGGAPKVYASYYMECENCGHRTNWMDTEKGAHINWYHTNVEEKKDPNIPTLEEFWEDK